MIHFLHVDQSGGVRGGNGEVCGCSDAAGLAHGGVGADLKHKVDAVVLRKLFERGAPRLSPERGTVVGSDDDGASHSLFQSPGEAAVHCGNGVGQKVASVCNFAVGVVARIAPLRR